jgi:uncharacterized integral membrane protein (TIGR00697 family)
MLNECLFVIQSLLVGGLTLAALTYGILGLVTITCLFTILSNLFVLKQISLFGLTATAADAFAVGALLGLNVMQEFFGRELTKKTIALNFACLIIYAFFSQLHLWYIPDFHDVNQVHFLALLGHAPRIVIASIIAYFAAQCFDYLFFGFLKRVFVNKFFFVRTLCANAASQLVDTILFAFLGLYGIAANIGQIIVVSYVIKLLIIAIATPVVGLAKKIVRSTP